MYSYVFIVSFVVALISVLIFSAMAGLLPVVRAKSVEPSKEVAYNRLKSLFNGIIEFADYSNKITQDYDNKYFVNTDEGQRYVKISYPSYHAFFHIRNSNTMLFKFSEGKGRASLFSIFISTYKEDRKHREFKVDIEPVLNGSEQMSEEQIYNCIFELEELVRKAKVLYNEEQERLKVERKIHNEKVDTFIKRLGA